MNNLQPLHIGRVNWIGLQALIRKECGRFLSVGMQTVLTPVVSSLLFYAVFSLAFGGNGRSIGDVPYMTFLAPGLIMMAMIQNAFANTSSSLMVAKIQGNIVDILMPPLNALELLTGLLIGGLMRGLLIGALGSVALSYFAGFGVVHLWAVLYYAVTGCFALALLGIIAGVWSEKFDHLATFTNFIIMPLTFLSGTFYAVSQLPELWYNIAIVNPFFFMIDGFRYGLIGQHEASIFRGAIIMLIVNIGLFGVTWNMIRKGYKIKS
jgi:ABC-2 type transport system permease protein